MLNTLQLATSSPFGLVHAYAMSCKPLLNFAGGSGECFCLRSERSSVFVSACLIIKTRESITEIVRYFVRLVISISEEFDEQTQIFKFQESKV